MSGLAACDEQLGPCRQHILAFEPSGDRQGKTLPAAWAMIDRMVLIKSAQGTFAAAEELVAALDGELMARTGSTGLDILVNNTGGSPVHKLDSTTPEVFEQVLSTNLSGAFFATQALSPRLPEGGRVIFVS